MPTREQVIEKWRALLADKQDVLTYRTAITGDGSTATTCDVTNKPGWAWVRYSEKQDRVSQVVNQVMPGAPQGVPVVIGKKYPSDKYYQILGVNMELYYEHTTPTQYVSYLLAKHGDTHLSSASDPAWIDIGNLLPGAVSAMNPESMQVTANPLLYEYGDVAQTFGGGVTDLTASVPGVAGTHLYVLISVDPDTNALEQTVGIAAPLPVIPGIPAVPLAHVPLAIVMVANGDTAIHQSDIYQYKFLFGSSGWLKWVNQIVGVTEAEWDYDMTMHAL